ncbi:MAG TPA: dolichyl-phosphate beta-glucosyltransferase [Solirubrobacterales bacterium]|nr:dolichyl-phosphate beta-glucosyltransferase [Solirubrobacterales bacterium]
MRPTVEIAIPVFNEEAALEQSVRRLHDFCRQALPYSFRIVIADNASEDGTAAIGARLAAELDAVAYLRLSEKGRGRALRRVWSRSEADVVAYMDVDLSTGLEALLPLIAPLISGHSDLAIGTRLARGSRVVRGPRREVISRLYNRLLHLTLRSRFSDAQCGFKAGRAAVVKALLPRVEDQAWFFDTELLVLAERSGLRIHEVPVDWVDDPDSRVDIVRTALDDLRGIARMGGEAGRFALVGVASTALYLLLFLALRAVAAPLAANAAALALSAVFNTAANRRFTFGRRGREALLTHHFQGLVVFGLCLGLTTGALAALGALAPGASQAVEVGVLVAANAAATLLRYWLLRLWVFGPRAGGGRPDPELQGLAACPTPRLRSRRAARTTARRA